MRIAKLAIMFLLMNKYRRRVCSFAREERWFDELWDNRYNKDYLRRWKADFRMSGSTFEKIVS